MDQRILFDFRDAQSMTGWQSVDDVVMGGRSASTILWREGVGLVFSGEVSLENNGGFASIRSPVQDYKLGETKGIGLRLMGDGKRYKLTIRVDPGFDGISYQVAFPTSAGVWQELFFEYNDFIPTYHGQVFPEEPPLDHSLIQRFGFIISEKQSGSFELRIARIWAER